MREEIKEKTLKMNDNIMFQRIAKRFSPHLLHLDYDSDTTSISYKISILDVVCQLAQYLKYKSCTENDSEHTFTELLHMCFKAAQKNEALTNEEIIKFLIHKEVLSRVEN